MSSPPPGHGQAHEEAAHGHAHRVPAHGQVREEAAHGHAHRVPAHGLAREEAAHGHAHRVPPHGHAHAHERSAGASQRRLALVFALTVLFMLAELVGGWLSGSLALLADAVHMLSDAGALGLALFAGWLARRPAGARHSYGYHRAEILAVLGNGALLLALTPLILVEAWDRLARPVEIAAPVMMAVAGLGLAVNLLALRLLAPAAGHNLNVRGAWLHVLSDAAGSVGALVAGALVWLRGWLWADALASVMIAALVLVSGVRLLREAVDVLMEGTPAHIDLEALRSAMLGAAHVREVHDLHVWTITSGLVSLSAHVVVDEAAPTQRVLGTLRELLAGGFGIAHCTLQLETTGCGERCAAEVGGWPGHDHGPSGQGEG